MRQPPSLLRADSHAERAVAAGRRRSLLRFLVARRWPGGMGDACEGPVGFENSGCGVSVKTVRFEIAERFAGSPRV